MLVDGFEHLNYSQCIFLSSTSFNIVANVGDSLVNVPICDISNRNKCLQEIFNMVKINGKGGTWDLLHEEYMDTSTVRAFMAVYLKKCELDTESHVFFQ